MEETSVQQIPRILESWFKLTTKSLNANIQDYLGVDIYCRLLGRVLGTMAIGLEPDYQDRYAMLNEIPSEAAESERRFLYNFFKFVWDGKGDVLEIGPLYGGTSRPIAMGMLENQNYDGGKFYTYDRFLGHRQGEELIDFLKPLFAKGILQEDKKERIKSLTMWKEVFELIHNQYEYSKIISVAEGALPVLPHEVHEIENIFKVEPAARFGAVFIDGCKSWYGTKYFMREIADNVPAGSYFMFQDYGTFTCFWLPAFVGLFTEHFRLISYIHHTYSFELIKPFTVEMVDRYFPDTPFELGRSNLDTIFGELLKGAFALSDSYLLLNYQLQHAGAIAYLGNKDEAQDKIIKLLYRPEFTQYRGWILASLNTPTYTPEGQISL